MCLGHFCTSLLTNIMPSLESLLPPVTDDSTLISPRSFLIPKNAKQIASF